MQHEAAGRMIIDGLVWDSDGDASSFVEAGVAAINLTLQGNEVEHDFEPAIDQVAAWLARIRRHESKWRLVTASEDILAAKRDGKVGLIMGWQNLRPIADRLDRLDLLHRLGLRILQLTYNTRNMVGDGCIEPVDAGLSLFGQRVVARMNDLRIAIDLSHCGERTTMMAAELSSQPVLITHCGARSISDWQRNKSDASMRAVIATGGLVGVSLYGPIIWNGDPACFPTLEDYWRHIDHIVNLVGIDHIAMGTDFFQNRDMAAYAARYDMSIDHINPGARRYSIAFGDDIRDRYPNDGRGVEAYGAIVEMLARKGWSNSSLDAFLGNNLLRVLREIWGA